MDLLIRVARPEDKEEILRVIESTQASWDKKYAKPYYDDYFAAKAEPGGNEAVYVGILGSKIIAVIGYYCDRYETKNYWLGWFYVNRKVQRGGYGKKLLDHVITELRRKRIKRLYVYTSSHESYTDALIFYLKNGFRIEATVRDYYETGEDQIVLSKLLTVSKRS